MDAKDERAIDVVAYARHMIASRMIDQIRETECTCADDLFVLTTNQAVSLISSALSAQAAEVERLKSEKAVFLKAVEVLKRARAAASYVVRTVEAAPYPQGVSRGDWKGTALECYAAMNWAGMADKVLDELSALLPPPEPEPTP